MSVSIANIVAQDQQAATDQMQQFEAFIADSKALKGALQQQQQDADKRYQQLQTLVDSLQAPTAANGLQPIQILADNADYNAALQHESLLTVAQLSSAASVTYIDNSVAASEQFMQQREDADTTP